MDARPHKTLEGITGGTSWDTLLQWVGEGGRAEKLDDVQEVTLHCKVGEEWKVTIAYRHAPTRVLVGGLVDITPFYAEEAQRAWDDEHKTSGGDV